MVTVLLSGGLGNQMFQYAAARTLAKRLGTSLAIDLYALEKKTYNTTRHFELDIFNLEDVRFVSKIKNKLFIKGRPIIQKNRNLFQKSGLLSDTYAIRYEPVFETIKGNISLSGYFQNEKYFKGIEADIRKEFTFKGTLDGKNELLAQQLSEKESIAIHIRRGDYVTDKNAVANFVTCSIAYYEKAIKLISTKINSPVFYVFSDDFDWVKENLNFGDHPNIYVDWNKGRDSYIDLRLMSLCKHNIIANSSFSWWAAWLNNNPEKIILAPDKWFLDEAKNKLLDDFYPKGWTKIE